MCAEGLELLQDYGAVDSREIASLSPTGESHLRSIICSTVHFFFVEVARLIRLRGLGIRSREKIWGMVKREKLGMVWAFQLFCSFRGAGGHRLRS